MNNNNEQEKKEYLGVSDNENLVILCGNLARDPEFYAGTSGNDMVGRCTFPLIVDNLLPNGTKSSDRINIIAWGKVAEHVMNKVHKGTSIVIKGSLHTRSYVDKNGNKQHMTEVKVDKLISSKQPTYSNI